MSLENIRKDYKEARYWYKEYNYEIGTRTQEVTNRIQGWKKILHTNEEHNVIRKILEYSILDLIRDTCNEYYPELFQLREHNPFYYMYDVFKDSAKEFNDIIRNYLETHIQEYYYQLEHNNYTSILPTIMNFLKQENNKAFNLSYKENKYKLKVTRKHYLQAYSSYNSTMYNLNITQRRLKELIRSILEYNGIHLTQQEQGYIINYHNNTRSGLEYMPKTYTIDTICDSINYTLEHLLHYKP